MQNIKFSWSDTFKKLHVLLFPLGNFLRCKRGSYSPAGFDSSISAFIHKVHLMLFVCV